VTFRAVLERGNRVQVPKNVRWEFKLETDQVMRVSVGVVGSFAGKECFYARMRRDGRITIPKVTVSLLQDSAREGQSLVGTILNVELEPA
jgi:hypothetical protein